MYEIANIVMSLTTTLFVFAGVLFSVSILCPIGNKYLRWCSWALIFLSLTGGALAMMAVVAHVGYHSESLLDSPFVKYPSMLQVISLPFGVIVLLMSLRKKF